MNREDTLVSRLKELLLLVVELPINERENLTRVISTIESGEYVDPSDLEIDGSNELYSDIASILDTLNIINPYWIVSVGEDEEFVGILSRIRQGCGN